MIRLITALVLLLALAAPAFAQSSSAEQGSGDSQVKAQQDGTGKDGGAEAQQEDGGGEDFREDDPEAGEVGAAEADSEGGSDGSSATNGRNDVNCDDFTYQEEAQEFYDSQGGREGGDEDRLDEDRGEDDGRACEYLPSRDDDERAPNGGLDSGLGGTASQSSGEPTDASASLPLTLIGVLLAAVAGLGVFVGVRKRD